MQSHEHVDDLRALGGWQRYPKFARSSDQVWVYGDGVARTDERLNGLAAVGAARGDHELEPRFV